MAILTTTGEANEWGYHLPTHVTFGPGALEALRPILEGDPSVALFMGQSLPEKIGLNDRLRDLGSHLNTSSVFRVSPNPDPSVLEDARTFLKGSEYDTVIAIGGGSVIDAAKSAAILADHDGPIHDYLSGKKTISRDGLPLIAVPTTAGTGSEVTPWATVWDFQQGKKYSLSSPHMFPSEAIVDPVLTLSLPSLLTAMCGIDALCHAFESYWARGSQPVSGLFAREAIRLILGNLTKVFSRPNDLGARSNMALGSLLAGYAFSNTRTTAIHSISYPLTLKYKIPHGFACGITLIPLLRYNAAELGEKTLGLTDYLGMDSLDELEGKVHDVLVTTKAPLKLSELGIKKGDINYILQNAFTKGRMDNNPRTLARKDLERILNSLL